MPGLHGRPDIGGVERWFEVIDAGRGVRLTRANRAIELRGWDACGRLGKVGTLRE